MISNTNITQESTFCQPKLEMVCILLRLLTKLSWHFGGLNTAIRMRWAGWAEPMHQVLRDENTALSLSTSHMALTYNQRGQAWKIWDKNLCWVLDKTFYKSGDQSNGKAHKRSNKMTRAFLLFYFFSLMISYFFHEPFSGRILVSGSAEIKMSSGVEFQTAPTTAMGNISILNWDNFIKQYTYSNGQEKIIHKN